MTRWYLKEGKLDAPSLMSSLLNGHTAPTHRTLPASLCSGFLSTFQSVSHSANAVFLPDARAGLSDVSSDHTYGGFPFKSQSDPLTWKTHLWRKLIIILCVFFECGNWGIERLNNLSKFAKVVERFAPGICFKCPTFFPLKSASLFKYADLLQVGCFWKEPRFSIPVNFPPGVLSAILTLDEPVCLVTGG